MTGRARTVARYQARSPFELASTRSVSDRTLDETENAIAARQADSHSTVNSALPRLLEVFIQ